MKKNLKNKLKRFKGITFETLKINLNTFHGFGITILSIEWLLRGSVCLISKSFCLLHLGLREYVDESLILSINVLGFHKTFFIKPRIIRICSNCNEQIPTTTTIEDRIYCEECDSWQPLSEVKEIKWYKEGNFNINN